MGFTWSPFGELSDIPQVHGPPKRCTNCNSFLAKGNGDEQVLNGLLVWTCAFCYGDNDATEISRMAIDDPHACAELSVDTFEYVHAEKPQDPTETKPGAIVLIVDENMDEREASWARLAGTAVHSTAAARDMHFILMTVGSCCSVATRSSAESSETPVMEVLSAARASRLSVSEKERFLLELPSSTAPIDLSNSYSTPGANDEPEDLPQASPSGPTDPFVIAHANPYGGDIGNSPPSLENLNSPDGGTGEASAYEKRSRSWRMSADMEARRLDIAIKVAFELLSGIADMENSRILSLITGPPTMSESLASANGSAPDGDAGKGSPVPSVNTNALAKVYERVGAKAGELRVALDFLVFGGNGAFSGQILLAAVKRSRGGVAHCAAHSYTSGTAVAQAAAHLANRSTKTGVVSIRVGAPLVASRVIGPAFPTPTAHTYSVPGVDGTVGFTVLLKTRGDRAEGTTSVVQLAAKADGRTRVITAHIPIVRTAGEFLRGMDAEMSALVLGKACVVSGGGLIKPDVAGRAVDAAVRVLLQGSESAGGVVRLLYELRRGALIEEHLDGDQSLMLRSMFLRAECSLASLLMSPRLFTNVMTDETSGLMAEVGLDRQHLRDDAVLVLDTGLNIFVYIGSDASEDAERAISESAGNVAAMRTWPCQLWKVRGGDIADFVVDTYLSAGDDERKGGGEKSVQRGFVEYCASI